MPDVSIDTIVRYTNQKYEQYVELQTFLERGNPFFMGLSFISRAHKATKNPISDLYDSKFLPHFKAALTRDRLLLLIKLCRFDDVNTRDDQKDDPFGHIREVWDTFNNRCREPFGLGPHTTIDKTLQKFRGHCRFSQCMPSAEQYILTLKSTIVTMPYRTLAKNEMHLL